MWLATRAGKGRPLIAHFLLQENIVLCATQYKNVKAYATIPIGIMGSDRLSLLGWGSRCFSKKEEKAWIRVYAVSFYQAEIPLASIKQQKTTLSHNTFRHCRVRLYAFVGQPFSKQLYDKSLFIKLTGYRPYSFLPVLMDRDCVSSVPPNWIVATKI